MYTTPLYRRRSHQTQQLRSEVNQDRFIVCDGGARKMEASRVNREITGKSGDSGK